MHFLLSLFFLVPTMLLTIGYVTLGYAIVLLPGMFWRRYRPQRRKDLVYDRSWRLKFKKKFWAFLMIASVFACSSVYIKQRIEWTGKDNAHLTAKEYWVSGQVLAVIRYALVRVLHPDNILLWPSNRLQECIYKKGIQYLPKEDGEIAVWTDAWFLYPYSRKGLLPKVSVENQHGWHLIDPVFKTEKKIPKIICHLDRCWNTMEAMATKNYEDKQMMVQNYYRNFPRLAMYYHAYDGFYMGKYLGSSEYLLNDPFHQNRLIQLLKWLEDLKACWEKYGIYKIMRDRYTVVEAGRQVLRLSVLQDLLNVLINRKEFRCDHLWVKKLHQSYLDLMSDDASENILLRYLKVNRNQASLMYKQNVYTLNGEECQYILKRFCDCEFPKEKLLLMDKKDYRRSQRSIEIHLRNQIKLIQEVLNE